MIRIDDTYLIDVTTAPISFIFKRVIKPKEGNEDKKERHRILGYYSTVDGVLNAYVDQVIASDLENGSYTLKQAISHIIKQREQLAAMIADLIPQLEDKKK